MSDYDFSVTGKLMYERAMKENERLREALRLFRSLVKEGGVPRYTITPGAALNALLEEIVDPLLKL